MERAGTSLAINTEGNLSNVKPEGLITNNLLDSPEPKAWDICAIEKDSALQQALLRPLSSRDIATVSLLAAPLIEPTGEYMGEISQVKLLTAAEEVKLAQIIEKARAAREIIASEDYIPQELEILQEAISDGLAARKKMIESNLRLVVSVARKYYHYGLCLEYYDLIQEGNIGLLRAVEKYDWRRGFKFSTYAFWWIRQGVTRSIMETSSSIRIPIHENELIAKYHRECRTFAMHSGRSPTLAEISQRMELDIPQIQKLREYAHQKTIYSLEMKVGENRDIELKDRIADKSEDQTDMVEEMGSKQILDKIKDLIKFTPNERYVLDERVLGNPPRSLGDIGQQLKLTRERIRQIEADAETKLRDFLHKNSDLADELRDSLS